MREYRTVEIRADVEFTERRSRFVGHIQPVRTEQEAISFINEVKAKNWDATHNVYAYTIREGQIKRYSDDGEPQGTAGIPVLDVLQKSDVTDAVIVVTRYFGGVLLGAGGLVRSYSHSAASALQAAKIITMRECLEAHLSCEYSQYGRIQALILECCGIIDDTVFMDTIKLNFHITEDNLTKMEPQLADATCGSVQIMIDQKSFYKFF